jgi:hypothetical protein
MTERVDDLPPDFVGATRTYAGNQPAGSALSHARKLARSDPEHGQRGLVTLNPFS